MRQRRVRRYDEGPVTSVLHETVARPFLAGAVLLGLLGCAAAEPSPRAVRPAVEVEPGAVAGDQVMAVGRNLEVRGEVRSDAVVLNGDALVDGAVEGDVIVLGGDVVLGDGARVRGDVFVLGGQVAAAAGARVEGRTVAWPRAPSSLLVLAEGPVVERPAPFGAAAALQLALLFAWLLVTLALLPGFETALVTTAANVVERPFRSFFVGLVAALAVAILFAVLIATAPMLVGAPLLAVCGAAIVACKIWGTVAVFLAVGLRLLPERLGLKGRPLAAALAGLAALGVVRMLPWVGGWTWAIVTCVGIGGAVASGMGRRDPWFDGL